MKPCWCMFVLAVLVIIFVWWQVDWANIALTVIGIVIAIMALMGKCCCAEKCKAKAETK